MHVNLKKYNIHAHPDRGEKGKEGDGERSWEAHRTNNAQRLGVMRLRVMRM